MHAAPRTADERKGEQMTAMPLSAGWFDRARSLVDGLPPQPGVSCRVQFEADDLRWHLVVEDGRVVAWDLGVVPDPQVTVRMPMDTALAVHRPGSDGTEALARSVLVEDDGSEGLLSPVDVGHRPELDALPLLPGADVTLQYHLADGPFGDVSVWWDFVSGRSRDIQLGTHPEPDVTVWVPFQRIAPVRAGSMSILEALEGGRVEGAEGPLMLYAGLEESPELQAVGRSCGPSAAVLGALGLVTSQAVFQEALRVLAEDQP